MDLRHGLAAQKRPLYDNDRHEKGVKGSRTVLMPEDGRTQWGVQNWLTVYHGGNFNRVFFFDFRRFQWSFSNFLTQERLIC